VRVNGTIACSFCLLNLALKWHFQCLADADDELNLHGSFRAASFAVSEIININSFFNEVSAWVFGNLLFHNHRFSIIHHFLRKQEQWRGLGE
jgi:hypothetical protein